MKNFKLYSKVLSFLTSGVVISSFGGCGKKVPSVSFDSSVSSTYVTDSCTTLVTDSISTTSTTLVTSPITLYSTVKLVTSSCVTAYVASSSVSSNDDIVISYFESLGSDVKSSYDYPDFSDKGKLYFITCVDFLFYDGSINGVKFSDMTDMARSQLVNDISTIDGLICSKYPNYKESISYGASSIYDKASDIIKSGSSNLSDYSRLKLGEENYSNLEEYKDLFVEQTSRDWDSFKDIVGDAYSYSKSKVKDKYEDFRGQY